MKLRVLSLMILTLSWRKGLSDDTTQCKPGWSYYESSCYLFVTAEMDTWIEATAHCNILHGSLTDILDAKENNFIKSQLHLKHALGCYYMSATDVEVEGKWVWPKTEDPVEYFDWGPTEPQNAGAGENCICLSAGVNYSWVDVPCHSLRHFICKTRSEGGTGQGIIG